MAKKRTRKQKEKAKHQFLVTSVNKPKSKPNDKVVKGQFNSRHKPSKKKVGMVKSADLLDKEDHLASAKRDVVKSILLASLILGLELVIYLAWRA
ncbi:hypothetical protein ACFL0F_00905 [Patescibacteria group bacterium]